MADGLVNVDWRAPWFEPWRQCGERVARRHAEGLAVRDALNEEGALVRFSAPGELEPGDAYERHIHSTGSCPTRDNLHDFFNGLCWIGFPQSKKRLNELQATEIDRVGVGAVRGPVRDAITVFDENGALLHAPTALWDALLARDWRVLFIDLRPMWAQARLWVFGHALLEKLVYPRKTITAHVWRAECPDGPMPEVDEWLAAQLTADTLSSKPFTPLPVLGLPGWWPPNKNFSFYDDSLVYRPAGRQNET